MRKKKLQKEKWVWWKTVPEKCSPEEAEILARHVGEYVLIRRQYGMITMREDRSGSSVQVEFGKRRAPPEVESIIRAKCSKMKPLMAETV